MDLERYWAVAGACLAFAAATIWLILRRRLTLQSSLAFLVLLLALATAGLLAPYRLAEALGFAVPSNFFFASSIAALSLLHLFTLLALSRLELRSISLTQELALLEERVARQESARAESPQLLSG